MYVPAGLAQADVAWLPSNDVLKAPSVTAYTFQKYNVEPDKPVAA